MQNATDYKTWLSPNNIGKVPPYLQGSEAQPPDGMWKNFEYFITREETGHQNKSNWL